MKIYQLTLVIFLLIFFLTNNSEAQQSGIDSLKILPINPTTNDTVKVVAYTSLPYSGCSLTNTLILLNNFTIQINALHSLGLLPVFCSSVDTTEIGNLNEGTYTLIYGLTDSDSYNTYDLDTIVFIVQQINGLEFSKYSNDKIKVYPNPNDGKFTIEFTSSNNKNIVISITDIIGKIVFEATSPQSLYEFDGKELPSGIYMVKVIISEINYGSS